MLYSMNKKVFKQTPFGLVGIIWTAAGGNPKICRVVLPKATLSAERRVFQFYPDVQADTCVEIESVADAIKGILEGSNLEISLAAADLTACSAFQRRVLRAQHRIPPGSVSSYQLIGNHLGKFNAARAVGNALASNPFPIIVPCHRTIRSDRRLGGYGGGIGMKRALCEQEGIRFDDAGRVVCNRFYYQA